MNYVFVDTNVILHFQFLDEVDWATAWGFDDVTLVLAPVVLSELDNKKVAGGRKERVRARKVLALLDRLGLSDAPVLLRDGVSLAAIGNEPRPSTFLECGLDPEINDDRLLSSLIERSREVGDPSSVWLATDDGGIRVKARTRSIQLVAVPEELRLADEPDEVERELADLRRQLSAAVSAAPRLRLTVEGLVNVGFVLRVWNGWDEKSRKKAVAHWRARYPYHESSSNADRIGSFFEPSALTWNASIDEAFGKFERYLKEWPAAAQRYCRILPFCFVLENVGTAPADDVSVILRTSGNGIWRRRMFKPPSIPKPVRWDSMFGLGMSHLSPAMAFDHSLLRPAAAEEGGPDFSEDGGTVKYWAKRSKHNVPVTFDKVHFEFASEESVTSFQISYELHAANLRQPTVGSINVEIERQDAVLISPFSLENADDE